MLALDADHRAGASRDARGRLSEADRPDADRLICTGAWHVIPLLADALPPHLARHDRDQRRQPVAVPARDRCGLGHLVNHGHFGARRRLLHGLLRARAAGRLSDADRFHRERQARAIAASEGGRLPSAATTPLEPGEIMAGHLLFVAFRVLTSSLAFILVMAGLRCGRRLVGSGSPTGCAPHRVWRSPLRLPHGRWPALDPGSSTPPSASC